MTFRADFTMNAYNGEGEWKIVEPQIMWLKFRGFENRLKFSDDFKEAVLIWPVRDPPSRMVQFIKKKKSPINPKMIETATKHM